MQPWRAVGQQDAGEFLQSISPSLIQRSLRPEWEARKLPNAPGLPSEVTDAGSVWPLPEPPSAQLSTGAAASSVTLQSLIDQRATQTRAGQALAFAAAEGPPPLLLLQVARFTDMGHQLRGSIVPPFEVHFPYFTGSDNPTHREEHTVQSIICHLGGSTTSGHYRTALLKRGKVLFITDDGKQAQTFPVQHLDVAYSNSYIFCLTKTD